MSPTLTTCRILHNTSPIVLVDCGGHLFARLAEPTMVEPGENFVFLRKKKNGAVFAKVKTAPENSPDPITNPRVDVSVTNGGSPWHTAARIDVLPTDRKKFDKTSKQTMHVKRVHFDHVDKVVGGLPHFSEHVSDDVFVSDKQPNDEPPALPKNLAESVKSSYSISLADLPKMHRTLDHRSRSHFSHILRQALNVDTLPDDLQNAANLVHDHCVICVKSSRPVPRPRVALPSVHQPGVCASVDYGDIHYPSRVKAFRVQIMAYDFSGRVYASIVDDASVTGERTAEAFMMLSCETFAKGHHRPRHPDRQQVLPHPAWADGNRSSYCPDGRSLGFARGLACASTPSGIYQNCHRACKAISRSCPCVSSALCELNEDVDWSVAPGD
jgi:hypothetical protein